MNESIAEAYQPVSSFEAKALLEKETDLVLIDVREDYEYEFCRIEGAKHIPLSRLPECFESLSLIPEQPILIYCHHGKRSAKAALYLSSKGFKNLFNLEGGIDAWSRDIDSLVPQY
ncbi:MAG: rhodanese-like domain-containing protein [Candidatus Caenarcaniphilales bacterium]|nr:rhodanese-like domain-containing protein [Candidatus Caenarcaniphilales bacterium]